MAKNKEREDENITVGQKGLTPKEINLSKVAFPHGIGVAEINMEATDKHKFMPGGTKFKAHKAIAEQLEKKGWATIIGMLALFMLCSITASAQVTFKNSVYATASVDTVTNTGTAIVKARIGGEGIATAVQAVVTKISGTVAGTLTLFGSVDGVNFEACRLKDVSTALHTYTATDVATQTFIWNLGNVSYLHYQVRHVGTGTMAAKLSATGLIR